MFIFTAKVPRRKLALGVTLAALACCCLFALDLGPSPAQAAAASAPGVKGVRTNRDRVDYLVMNMGQAAALCGLKGETPKTARIAAGLMSGRVRRAVVIHMDDNGVLLAKDGVLTTLDTAAECRIADYSGATDCFVGVFGAELVKGAPVEEAAIKAHRAALLCSERVGVYTSLPTGERLREL